MSTRVSKYRVVAVAGRLATPRSTRVQWSCLGFICGLARTASASDEVIVNGYWMEAGERRGGIRRYTFLASVIVC